MRLTSTLFYGSAVRTYFCFSPVTLLTFKDMPLALVQHFKIHLNFVFLVDDNSKWIFISSILTSCPNILPVTVRPRRVILNLSDLGSNSHLVKTKNKKSLQSRHSKNKAILFPRSVVGLIINGSSYFRDITSHAAQKKSPNIGTRPNNRQTPVWDICFYRKRVFAFPSASSPHIIKTGAYLDTCLKLPFQRRYYSSCSLLIHISYH
jgi:hypothetical protein